MKKLIFFALLLMTSISSFGADRSYFDAKFNLGSALNFQEKFYIQTDRDSYTTGETIWFRVHRVDATYHNPRMYSGLVYVDIYDFEDELIKRMMIMPTDSVFSGSYKIPTSATHGACYMVAYSNWAQNFDSDLYYRRKIYINNPQNKKVYVTHEFVKEKEKLRVNFQVTSIDDYKWVEGRYMLDVTLVKKGSAKESKVVTRPISEDGRVSFTFPIEDNVDYLNVAFNESRPSEFSQRFVVPYTEDDIDLQFMPEGGQLIAGMQQRVAFKAISIDGLGAQVSGTIFDSTGGMVGFFGASHLGMGEFMLLPKAKEQYYAEIALADGTTKRFNLPEVQDIGVMVGCTVSSDMVKVMALASPEVVWDGKWLLVQCRGKLLQALPLSRNSAFNLPTNVLPNGVIQCSIVDTTGLVYSERLIFNNREDESTILTANLKQGYTKRSFVDVDLSFVDVAGAAVQGNFTASVVDDERAIVDTLVADIRSYILMTSDLQGNIENPNYYFDKSESLSRRVRNADLLMLTQGWKRFDLTDVLLDNRRDYEFSLQMGQAIFGRLKNLWKDEGKAGTLAVIAPKIFRIVPTDETGYFEVTNLAFPNGTKFVIQGVNEKGKSRVEVQVEDEGFRSITNPVIDTRYLLREGIVETTEASTFEEFYRNLSVDFYYENGIKVYIMDEISVVTNEEPDDYIDATYTSLSDYRITSEDLTGGAYATIWDWLAELPGVEVDETEYTVTVRGGTSVDLLVDEVSYELSDLDMISLTDIESIGFTKEQTNMALYTDATDGMIMIRLKSGASVSSAPKETASFFSIMPLGYHKSDAFYVPLYDTAELLNSNDFDGRVTIHWEPSIYVDESGKAKLQFYTADYPANYLVRIEGVTSKGDPISYTTRIKNE